MLGADALVRELDAAALYVCALQLVQYFGMDALRQLSDGEATLDGYRRALLVEPRLQINSDQPRIGVYASLQRGK